WNTNATLHYFYRGQHNLFYVLMRRVNLLSYHTKSSKKPYSMKKTKNANDKERLGYLTYENNTWMFVDTTQSDHSEICQVIENRSEKALTVDSPVRAILRDEGVDRKSTRLNSSHVSISYAVFCLKKKNQIKY